MKQVVFYDYTSGRQQILGKVIYDGEKIMFEGLPKALLEEIRNGIQDRRNGERVFPDDGLRFLDALPYYYRGSMLVASLVQEL